MLGLTKMLKYGIIKTEKVVFYLKRDSTKVFIILSIIGLIYIFTIFTLDKQSGPVDSKDKQLVEVNITKGVKQAAKELKSKGLINSKLAFILKTQLNGTAGKIKTGSYYLSKNMDTEKIMSIISIGGYSHDKIEKIRIKEGSTIDNIADVLFENKIIVDKERFLSECNNKDNVKDLKLYNSLIEDENKKYILEGYLFPDTYEFYQNSKPEDVILKMATRFDTIYDKVNTEATNAGLNADIVLKLASIIEKEANANDFNKVSAVLKNRMAKNMALQCDSTIRYVKNEKNTMILDKKQYEMDSPYNSYKYKDLPPSPICNPSLKAIEAVIHPDESYIKEGYLYFCSTENSSRDLVFAKTYEDHLNNVKKYIGDWRAYDDAIRNN